MKLFLAIAGLSASLMLSGCELNQNEFEYVRDDEFDGEGQVITTDKPPERVLGEHVILDSTACVDDGDVQLDPCPYYRQFLGITPQGYYWVQDFYNDENAKLTDPYLVTKAVYVNVADMSHNRSEQIASKHTSWYRDGQPRRVSEHADKRLNNLDEPQIEKVGTWAWWNEQGHKYKEESYRANLKHGMATRWYSNGQKYTQGNYMQGLKQGIFSHWYEDGTLNEQATFEDDVLNGMQTIWWPNGKIKSEMQYEQGRPIGISRMWDEDENIVDEVDHDL